MMSSEHSAENILEESLRSYFQMHRDQFALMHEICEGKASVSLRMLDWLCTNFSKSHSNTLPIESSAELYHLYKNCLRGFGKRYFDPFCRRGRKLIQIDDHELSTNIGQMNFFKWAFQNRVVDFAVEHKKRIETHMNERIKRARMQRKSVKCSRQHLSTLQTNHCHKRLKVVRVSFS